MSESLKDLVDRIIEDGVLTNDEHQEFMDRVHQDGQIDAEESEQISRIFKLIQEGKLQVVDEQRAAADRARSEEAAGDDSDDDPADDED